MSLRGNISRLLEYYGYRESKKSEYDKKKAKDKKDKKSDTDKDDERRKGGGKKKRRGAYSSGRREKMGLRNGKFSNIRSNIKKQVGIKRAKTKKRVISKTPFSSKHRWKKR